MENNYKGSIYETTKDLENNNFCSTSEYQTNETVSNSINFNCDKEIIKKQVFPIQKNDIINSNSKYEERNMSLVGLLICKDGIVGIGDYKSTKNYLGGYSFEEKERLTQKVFSNNNFILATYGPNEIIINNKKERLEDFINSTLINNVKEDYFFNNMANNTINNETIYRFLVGTTIDNDIYTIYNVEVSNGKFFKKVTNNNFVLGGDNEYFSIIEKLYINYNLSVDEASIKLNNIFKKIIALKDEEDKYHSVSLCGEKDCMIKILKK